MSQQPQMPNFESNGSGQDALGAKAAIPGRFILCIT